MVKHSKSLPKVELDSTNPLLEYYADGTGDLYGVARLIEATKDLPIFDCPLAAINLSAEIWQGCGMVELAWHVVRVKQADLDKPILLDWNGVIADGRHRVIKALSEGKRTIKARRMTWKPQPCETEGGAS